MAVHTLHENICWIIDNVQLMIIVVFFILFNAVRKGRKKTSAKTYKTNQKQNIKHKQNKKQANIKKTKQNKAKQKDQTNVIKQNKQTKNKYNWKSNEVKKTEKIIKKKGKNGKTKIIYNNKYIYNYFVVDEYFMSIVRLL